MLHNLFQGLRSLGNAQSLAYLFGGSIIGMFFGVVPGIGGAVILSMVLALINHISLTGAICLFLAVQAASYFSASVSAILLNTPAHPEAFAVTLDGFPMAQKGEAGRALGISATSTCVGGLVGCAVLVGFIQIINVLPLAFHPPEYVALIVIALVLVGTLGTDAASKALISAGIGLMISAIGSDPITGVFRYTFRAVGLLSGVSLVALALGLFAIPQMVLIFGTGTTIARQDMLGKELDSTAPVALDKGFGRQVIQGVLDTFHHRVALVRAALIGVITGIIPGIGGFAANFMSYGVAQQMSKRRELFGTGIPEGIIAPEGSSLAKEAGGLVPLVGLGIPGGVGGALFLAALVIEGVRPGYGFAKTYPSLPYEMMWVIALGGLIGTAAGLLSAPLLARVTRVPGPLLVPIIMALTVVGTFVSEVSFFAVVEVVIFSLVGLLLRRLRYSLASFVIGLVLGPTLETNLYLSEHLFPGIKFLSRPLADVLFAIGLLVLALKSVQLRRETQSTARAIEESRAEGNTDEVRRLVEQRHPYPLLGVLVAGGIAAFCLAFAIYGGLTYSFTNALLPVVAGGTSGLVALWRFPFELTAYLNYRRMRREDLAAGAAGERELVAVTGGERGPAGLAEAVEDFAHAPVLAAMELQDGSLELANSVAAPAVGAAGIRTKAWGRRGQYTREIVAFLWLFGLMGGCYLLGFDVAVPVFVFVYALAATRTVFKTLRPRLLYGILGGAATWAMAYEMLNILHLSFTPVWHL